MTDIKSLLDKRRAIKSKKPEFRRQCSHKIKRLGQKWRRPKGIDSKLRLRLKGYNKYLQIGYGSPNAVKGLDKSGLMPVIISNVKQLEALDKAKEGAIISSSVGDKKRVDIINKAKEISVKILNIKEPEKYVLEISESLKIRKESRNKRLKKITERKEKDKKKTKKDEDSLADKITDEEEKRKEEKKEKDKILTKKDMI